MNREIENAKNFFIKFWLKKEIDYSLNASQTTSAFMGMRACEELEHENPVKNIRVITYASRVASDGDDLPQKKSNWAQVSTSLDRLAATLSKSR